jgi:thymidylate synthase (FAD)
MKVSLESVHGSESFISRMAGISRNGNPSIQNLLTWGHVSPFEFASVTYNITCPIYIARQIFRHRTAKFMERSGRYLEPIYESNVPDQAKALYIESVNMYHKLLAENVDKEIARSVLPQGNMTNFYMQIDLRNLMNFFYARISKDAQGETYQIAREMLDLLFLNFPTVGCYMYEKLGLTK